MIKKNIFALIFIVLAIFVALAVFFVYNQKPLNISTVSDSQIILLLNKNSDAKDYIKNHPDFKIDAKEILTKQSIAAGQNGQNFKEVYQGLELQDNRYMRVDLMNQAGDRGLITVIDFKEKTVLKAYGIILLTAAQAQNGQISSPTTNK